MALIFISLLFVFITEKKKRNFYLKVLVFGSILGPIFDVANYFFNYYTYSSFRYLIFGIVPPEILVLYGPCCVIAVYLADFVNRV